MTSFARYKPLYLSMGIRNNGLLDPDNPGNYNPQTTPDNYIDARAQTTFQAPIVEKASDFLIAIERMELSLNGVPFYDADQLPREIITVRSRVIVASLGTLPLDKTAYSLTQLMDILATVVFTDPQDNVDFRCSFSISKDGFIIVTILGGKSFNDFQIEFPRRLNMILGISTAQQPFVVPAFYEAHSLFPRADIGDDLDHIVLQTNLPTNSDSLGNVKLQVLTDFSSPSTYSNSCAYGADGALVKQGFSSNIRQRVIYTPSERRYLELLGDFPIQEIEIQAWYLSGDELLKRVVLPLGGIFEIKLGFYLKQ